MAFEGVRPVLHLPFGPGPDQPIVVAELQALAASMLDAGVDGLVVLGLGSEAWTLREHERDAVLDAVTEVVAGRVPVVVGLDGATALALERAKRARSARAAGLMVLPPPGARTVQQLSAHYNAIADGAGLPIVVQDSPAITGVSLDVIAIEALAAHPLVRALKVEVQGAGAKVSAAVALGVEIVAGWGGLNYLESIERGARGCMPGCDLGPAILAIDRLARGGDAPGADELYRRILPYLSYVSQSLDLLLLGAKRHLRAQGLFSTETLRSPARALDPVEAATIDALLERLAVDGVPGFRTA